MFSKYLNLLPEKLNTVSILLFIPISFLSLKFLFDYNILLTKKYEKIKLFKKRHNCVVMYREKVITGWAPRERIIKSDIPKDCLEDLYEPILYFINTAELSIDVAIMLISVNSIFKAFLDASKKGVKIRIILNLEHVNVNINQNLKRLMREGIEIITHIGSDNMDSIMHYKYMVKDYNRDGGYAFFGSPNLTMSAFLNNYEDIVFMSSNEVVTALHNNFQDCWDYIKKENQTFMNKEKLSDLTTN